MSSLGSLTSIYSRSLLMGVCVCVCVWGGGKGGGSDVSLILIFKTGCVEYLAGKRPSHCWYCSIVFVIAVPTHLHVAVAIFICFVSLFSRPGPTSEFYPKRASFIYGSVNSKCAHPPGHLSSCRSQWWGSCQKTSTLGWGICQYF